MSIADELEKLANLRDKGVLTEDEFRFQKAKIIGKQEPPISGKVVEQKNEDQEIIEKYKVNTKAFQVDGKNNKILGFIILITLFYGLIKCSSSLLSSSIISNASNIIKKDLRSPSSFSLVSGKELWTGKDSNGNSAYIVRVEYDAQNGFGSMIRGCKLVAYYVNGEELKWKLYEGIRDCDPEGVGADTAVWVEVLRKDNFGTP